MSGGVTNLDPPPTPPPSFCVPSEIPLFLVSICVQRSLFRICSNHLQHTSPPSLVARVNLPLFLVTTCDPVSLLTRSYPVNDELREKPLCEKSVVSSVVAEGVGADCVSGL